jgi:uncharacterized membrane protein
VKKPRQTRKTASHSDVAGTERALAATDDRTSETPAVEIRGKTAKNIESILRLEKDDQAELTGLHRLSHHVGWFVGTIYFLIAQCVFTLLWVLLNAGPWQIKPAFDSYPFPLLSAVLAMEAVLLTSFVLIRQSAINRQSERRNHLDLQINLLAEEEVTYLLNLVRGIASKLDVNLQAGPQSEELAKATPVETIARDLRDREEH